VQKECRREGTKIWKGISHKAILVLQLKAEILQQDRCQIKQKSIGLVSNTGFG
jgi:hypothetical protein